MDFPRNSTQKEILLVEDRSQNDIDKRLIILVSRSVCHRRHHFTGHGHCARNPKGTNVTKKSSLTLICDSAFQFFRLVWTRVSYVSSIKETGILHQYANFIVVRRRFVTNKRTIASEQLMIGNKRSISRNR